MKMAGLDLTLAGALGLDAVLVLMATIPRGAGACNKKAALLARRCDFQTLAASVIAPARSASSGVGAAMPSA
jgi:hypothetical protein